jgi:hypothetical protein
MWLVIWLAGEAGFVMGGEPGMSPELCSDMRELVITDIEAGVRTDPDGTLWVEADNGDRLPFREWEVTCEENKVELGAPRNG